jgi:polyphosphate kinase 2 (PPK2 family)
MSKSLSLKKLLKEKKFPKLTSTEAEKSVRQFQLDMLRIQQGIWHRKQRAIIVFEGFDAAGKGGAIRRLVETLDPRGYRVYPIGPPEKEEQAKHYLYRFWQKLPSPGAIAIFDRSWYGRVLVEKVDRLTPPARIKEAYDEICRFEKMLVDDGIEVIKIFLAIDKDEQLQRFQSRLQDPYKQWKITMDDVKAREKWDDYVDAAEEMFERTSTKNAKWHMVPANDKDYARVHVLKIVSDHLQFHSDWMEKKKQQTEILTLEKALHKLGVKKKSV